MNHKFFLITLLSPLLVALGVVPQQGTGLAPVKVDVPIQEWLHSYLGWTHQHPEVIHRDHSSSPEPLNLEMPYLELFSPSGVPLYRGTDAKKNAAFLRTLQREPPSHSLVETDRLRPTLREYLGMMTELTPFSPQLLSGSHFTVFAVTYTDKPYCTAQNEAIREWRSRPDIQIVEIRLKI